MPVLNLTSVGLDRQVELGGEVESDWLEGRGLVFLFAENHRDRAMKRANVLNACRLIDAGVAGSLGTEVPMAELDRLEPAELKARAAELFELYRSDDAVIDHLNRTQPWWYGVFQFGSTVRLLRPGVCVACVEDPSLREEMKPICEAYELADHGARPHPCPEYPRLGDHPHNLLREAAMLENLLRLRARNGERLAAILNTGSDHSRRLAAGLKAKGINYFLVVQPASADMFS
jgi:hypothetical protein